MGRVREQTKGQVLPPHCGRKAWTAKRSRKVELHGRSHRRDTANQPGGNMTLWSRLRSWLRSTLRRSRMESDMDAELRFHIESYADDLVSAGVSREESTRRARLEFGGIERAKEECRDAKGVNIIESLIQDLRYGLRILRKNVGFTVVALLSLAL